MGAVLDLEDLPLTDNIEFLRYRMRNAPVPLDLEPHPDTDLVVRTRAADLGCVHLLCTKGRGGDVVRTDRLARDGTRPSLLVSVVDQGSTTVVRGEHAMTLRAGDIGLYTTDEPYRLTFPPGSERLTYQVPLDELALPTDLVRRQLRTVIHPDSATAAAVSAYLRSAARSAPAAPKAEQAALERPTLDLIRLLLTRVVSDAPTGARATAASLATRVEEHAKARLGDPDLSISSIAEAFAISERYAYLILARRGIDLGDAIRRYRLGRAARLLEDSAHSAITIAGIAHRCGFADHSHFSRAFRAEFGASPSEWRRRSSSE